MPWRLSPAPGRVCSHAHESSGETIAYTRAKWRVYEPRTSVRRVEKQSGSSLRTATRNGDDDNEATPDRRVVRGSGGRSRERAFRLGAAAGAGVPQGALGTVQGSKPEAVCRSEAEDRKSTRLN